MRLKRTTIEQGGFVVVVVLCMVMMLAVLLLGFNYKSCANLRAVDDLRKFEQALNCSRAGLNIAIAAIKGTSDTHTNKTLRNLFSGENTFNIGNGKCSITISEENSKFNVNLLKDKSGRLNRTRTDQLLRLIDLLNRKVASHPHIDYTLVPSIIDWIDSDDEVTCLPFIKHKNLGAESSYYSQLRPPYMCKNGPLETTEELLLVKGITPQIFERIRAYVTVYGDGEININYASKPILESLSEKMDADLAQFIIDQRKFKPFDSVTELRDVPGMTDSIYHTIKKAVTVSSTERYYLVTSRGNVDDLGCTIVAILKRNVKTKNMDVILYKELKKQINAASLEKPKER